MWKERSFISWLSWLGQHRDDGLDPTEENKNSFNHGLRKLLIVLVTISALGIMAIVWPRVNLLGAAAGGRHVDPFIEEVSELSTGTVAVTSSNEINQFSEEHCSPEVDDKQECATENFSSGRVTETEVKDITFPVYVCGAVVEPGVVKARPGDYLAVLLEHCGGLTEKADASRVNLAMEVQPHAMVYVPAIGEEVIPEIVSASNEGNGQQWGGAPSSTLNSDADLSIDKKININLADTAELCMLPGIGNATASAIIEYRQQHGHFTQIEDMMQVPGIKNGKFDRIKEYIKID
ncbi:MAG TPA: hypothetical protein GX717_01990 [Clostridiaceae bacterium]|nr:hypothetical protein [Clostridiaceae bacterium]